MLKPARLLGNLKYEFAEQRAGGDGGSPSRLQSDDLGPAWLRLPLAGMTMRKLILILLGVAIVALSFVAGKWWGSASASEKLMHEEMSRWGQLADLDSSVLRDFPVRSNAIASGTYLMDVWFPGSKLPTREVALRCENGQINIAAFDRNGGPQTLSLSGSVVWWTQEGAGYEANAKYVGLVDGGEMWGRVYGWNPGDQSVGLWRIYPKASNSGQQGGPASRGQPAGSGTKRTPAPAGPGG